MKKKDFVLYDLAGLGTGIILASSMSLLWNGVVMVATLVLIGKIKFVGWLKIILATLIITLGGGLIDWFGYIGPFGGKVYVERELVHNDNFNLASAGLLYMVIPVFLIAVFNFALAFFFLKLRKRDCLIFGTAMGIFTAPWLIYLNYLHIPIIDTSLTSIFQFGFSVFKI